MCSSSYDHSPCNRRPFLSESGCDRGRVDIHMFDVLPYCGKIDPSEPEIPPEIEDTLVNVPVPIPPCSCFHIDYMMKMKYNKERRFKSVATFGTYGDCCKGRYRTDFNIEVPCPVVGKSDKKISISIGYGTGNSSYTGHYISTNEDNCRIEPKNIKAKLKIRCPVNGGDADLKIGIGYGKGKQSEKVKIFEANGDECTIKPLSSEVNLNIPCPIVGRSKKYSIGVLKGWKGESSSFDVTIAKASAKNCELKNADTKLDIRMPCPVEGVHGKISVGLKYGNGRTFDSASFINAEGCEIKAGDVRLNLSVPCAVKIRDEESSSSSSYEDDVTVSPDIELILTTGFDVESPDSIHVSSKQLKVKRADGGGFSATYLGKIVFIANASGTLSSSNHLIYIDTPNGQTGYRVWYKVTKNKHTTTYSYADIVGLENTIVLPKRTIAMLPPGIFIKTKNENGENEYLTGAGVLFSEKSQTKIIAHKKDKKEKDGKGIEIAKFELRSIKPQRNGKKRGVRGGRWRPTEGSFYMYRCRGESSSFDSGYSNLVNIRELDYVPDLIIVKNAEDDKNKKGGKGVIGVAYGDGPGGIEAKFVEDGENPCEIKMLSPSGVMNIPCPIKVEKTECCSYYGSSQCSCSCEDSARYVGKGSIRFKINMRYYEQDQLAGWKFCGFPKNYTPYKAKYVKREPILKWHIYVIKKSENGEGQEILLFKAFGDKKSTRFSFYVNYEEKTILVTAIRGECSSSGSSSGEDGTCESCKCCRAYACDASGSSMSVPFAKFDPDCNMVMKDTVRMNIRIHRPIGIVMTKDEIFDEQREDAYDQLPYYSSSIPDSFVPLLEEGPIYLKYNRTYMKIGDVNPVRGIYFDGVIDVTKLFKCYFTVERCKSDGSYGGEYCIYIPSGCITVGTSYCSGVLNKKCECTFCEGGQSASSFSSSSSDCIDVGYPDQGSWYKLPVRQNNGSVLTWETEEYSYEYKQWDIWVFVKTRGKEYGVDCFQGGPCQLVYAEAMPYDDGEDSSWPTWGDGWKQHVGNIRVGKKRRKKDPITGGLGQWRDYFESNTFVCEPIAVQDIKNEHISNFDLVWYYSVDGSGFLRVEKVYCKNQNVSAAGINLSGPQMTDVTGAQESIYARIKTNPLDESNASGTIEVVMDPEGSISRNNYLTWLKLYSMSGNRVISDFRQQSLSNIQVYR